MDLACAGVICAANATCETDKGYVACRCDSGFKGDGYTKCVAKTIGNLDEDYIMMIVLIILLFIGLVVILIYFLCRRTMEEKPAKQHLVATPEKDPYDTKWEMLLSELEPKSHNDVPPPYNGISEDKQQPEQMTSFGGSEGDEEERVPVDPDDEEYEEESDVVKEFDNPTYDVVVINADTSIPIEGTDEVDFIGKVYTNPIEEPKRDVDDVERAFIGEVYTNPSFEIETDVDSVADVMEETLPESEVEKYVKPENIKITFEETGENQKTVTATIATPESNLTIHLNINLPSESKDSLLEPDNISV